MKKKKQRFNLIEEIRKYFSIQAFEEIIPWAMKNIDFSAEISAERNFLDFDLYPYQVEVINQWESVVKNEGIKEVVLVSPEQLRLAMEKQIVLLLGYYILWYFHPANP